MTHTLHQRLERKLAEAFATPWGDTVLGYELDGVAETDADMQALKGRVRFYCHDRAGTRREVHVAVLSGIETQESLDDWLAEALSRLLASHPDWAR